jgi:hypothetical protein
MVKVKDGIIRHAKIDYKVGDVIPGLSKDEEARLITLGVAEHVAENTKQEKANRNVLSADELTKLIDGTDNVVELEKILAEEQVGKNRKTVITAAVEKIKTLSSSEDNSDDNGSGSTNNIKGLLSTFDASEMIVADKQKMK